MFLLDTNIIGYLMKGTFPHLTEKVLSIPPSEIAVSAVSVFEMEYGALAKRGEMIGAYDVLIAAQGISRGMTVVTHNTREFGKVPNIVLEDWAE